MSGKTKCVPRHAITLTTYAELDQYARAFAKGHLRSMLLIGPPGVGKSRAVRTAVGPDVGWISGSATPFGIYIQAYRHQHQPLVLDDVDDLYRDPRGVRLLKSLCQTDPVRTVQWQTQTRSLDREGVPREFKTSSPIALIANDWTTSSLNIYAVEDRMHVVAFQPTAAEIHVRTATWFWDQEIFDFIGQQLPILADHSFRVYQHAWEMKSAGLNWQAPVLAHCHSEVTRIVASLKADQSYDTEEDRVRAFVASEAGCRATYFNHAKKLELTADIPQLKLRHTTPPGVSASPERRIQPPPRRLSPRHR